MNVFSMPPAKCLLMTLVLLMPICAIPKALPQASAQETEEESDPAEIIRGERLFLETRFSQLFKVFLDSGGDVNDPLPQGDPILDKVVNWKLTLEQYTNGPFAGQSINCRSCHFVDERLETAGYGMRTYTDFARRSPVPMREDGQITAIRNSPPLVNASLPRSHFMLHLDGEFPTVLDLVKGTLTGRNFGWLPGEDAMAMAHVTRVIREDSGNGELAQNFGGLSYSVLFTGTNPSIPQEFLLPEEFRLPVSQATDEQILHTVAQLIGIYTENLIFSQDESGNFDLSPYDIFLELNELPRKPRKWESDLAYGRKLLKHIEYLEDKGQLRFFKRHFKKQKHAPSSQPLEFVQNNPHTEDGKFQFHDQSFTFGEQELKGLKIFFTQKKHRIRPGDVVQGGIGNCIACHAPPNFTDFRFHNTGIAQAEYDQIHGSGAFMRLFIPALKERNNLSQEYLPATARHPNAKEIYRAIPTAENPQLTDLGVWNVFWNFDFPYAQLTIWQLLCEDALVGHKHFFKIAQLCEPSRLLPRAIAAFKTPGLRDLGHSAPYSHSGFVDTLAGVIRAYIQNSDFARRGELRNPDSNLEKIALTEEDIESLVAFLKSLNEDYE